MSIIPGKYNKSSRSFAKNLSAHELTILISCIRSKTILLEAKLEILEQNVKKFITEYTLSVAPLFKNIFCHSEIDSFDVSMHLHESMEDDHEINKEMCKKIYRSLAKISHPDLKKNHDIDFREINEAYKAGDLKKLIEFEAVINTESFESLISQYNIASHQYDELKNREKKLFSSKFYQLYAKNIELKKQGVDLIQEITNDLTSKVA